jgi:copper chaperone CopZ
MTGLVLKITGMSCHHCKMAVEQAAKTVPGVNSAVVDLNAGALPVQGQGLGRAAVAAPVEELGYRVDV